MKKIIHFSLIISIIYSCTKENFITDSSAKLQFSADTIMFDTIFTEIGSATQRFKVYNQYNSSLNISKIFLAKGKNSKYRLNINGLKSNEANDIEIRPKDSMYIFVEVTINPNRDAMLEQDSIVFQTNGNLQDIKLIAWGQDVYLVNGQKVPTQTWTNEKPFLVYNSMLIDTYEKLTIEEGTKIYFHKNSRLFVKGTIEVKGTLTNPVVFQGDRLEKEYEDVPGQWVGIWLTAGSKRNKFDYAIIKNAIIGIQVDTLAEQNTPTLVLTNSRIEHHTFAGLYAQGSTVYATNSVFGDCGYYSIALTIGGSYEFYNCTIANYWNPGYSNRRTPAVFLNNYYLYNKIPIVRNLTKAIFGNCIIYGNYGNEIDYDYKESGTFSYQFNHCLMRIDLTKHNTTDKNHFNQNIINEIPKFKKIEKYNYQLDTLSPAKDKADIETVIFQYLNLQYDYNGNSRLLDKAPDIGAFERFEKK